MKNSIENNLQSWNDTYHWSQDGDEWQGQARYCKMDYEKWKNSLASHLLFPYLGKNIDVLEIAPGHGRWSALMVDKLKTLTLVDLGKNNIEFCQHRFKDFNHINYIVNDGKTLPGVEDLSIDFVWSFDSFVHMDEEVINAYFSEISRVLKPGGEAVIHHAGRNHTFRGLGFIRHWGELGKQIYKIISMGTFKDDDGWRSNVSRKLIRQLAAVNGLKVIRQLQFWEEGVGVPRFNDCITILGK
jgi:ubiquinone/menaquinone biosynthesis C-methylase UbiE